MQDHSIGSVTRGLHRCGPGSRSRRYAVLFALVFVGASAADASQILAPAVGVPDSAMGGATVASPMTPSAAAFANPAGLMSLPPGLTSFSLGIPVGHTAVRASAPGGSYRTDSDFVAFAPEGGAVFETDGGLRWGFALYGSLGSVFDSEADSSVGVDDFLAESGISNASAMIAWNASDRLSFGFALSAIYGESHLRYFQGIDWGYTVRGPGVQAIGGLRYRLTDSVALGLGIRSPGMVWARGEQRMPSGEKEDVDLDLNLPSQIFAGVNADLTKRLSFGLCGRWTDASTFADSEFEFEQTPAGNLPYIRSASDEWRIAAGVRYAVTEAFSVMGGAGYADAIVPDGWVSPLLIDTDEWKVSGGLSYAIRGWIVDFTVGHSIKGEREVGPPPEAAVFPGKYSISGEIYLLGFRKEL